MYLKHAVFLQLQALKMKGHSTAQGIARAVASTCDVHAAWWYACNCKASVAVCVHWVTIVVTTDLDDLFIRLIINLNSCHNLLHITQDHVQMLVICLQVRRSSRALKPHLQASFSLASVKSLSMKRPIVYASLSAYIVKRNVAYVYRLRSSLTSATQPPTCSLPFSSRSPLSLTYTFSSRLSRMRSSGSFTVASSSPAAAIATLCWTQPAPGPSLYAVQLNRPRPFVYTSNNELID